MSAWEALLDNFEQDLGRVPEDAITSWQAPTEPLPAEFAERARALLHRQQRRITQLRIELDTVAEHLDAVRLIPQRSADAPAFLDVAV